MCGGFPCQDLSAANVVSRPGLKGDRSGLWRSFFGAVDYMRPSWVVVENVGSHWREWVPVVRRDLQRSGYASVPLALSPAELGYWRDDRRAFTTPGKTRVSIHMPRWASRLTLRVTDVRVERLGDISAEDCVAEGAMHWCEDSDVLRPREAFRALWEHVHGADAWERDVLRWVWVYSFEVEGRDAVS
jgi:hypothetical protein